MGIMESMGFSRMGSRQVNNKVKMEGETMKNEFTVTDRTERKEGETRIYNLIILDESGSMHSIYNQALTGVNETIQTIRKGQQENPELTQMLTFVTFGSGNSDGEDVRAIIGCEPIAEVKGITQDMYSPNGGTPLYDAMGMSISALKAVVRDNDRVIVTVVTDGYENCSHVYSASMVRELVEELRAKGWVFTYIGANQDSVESAGKIGITVTMDFCQDAAGTQMMWEKMNSSRTAFYRNVDRCVREECSMDFEADYFSQKSMSTRVTPNHISVLKPNQIFVFGSNLEGGHAGGAARIAVERFGAVMGQGVGLQGQSYAIPTMQGGVETIRPYVEEFIRFADSHPELTFLVTRIGCGIAGFTEREIAPLFAGAFGLPNVYLPKSFWKVLNYKYNG